MTAERIGSYPIEREIGRGGMGVVYLGRDTRLDRPVAIKVLPEAFASDPERLAQFEREARPVASLNHPNIAGIYGLEEEGGLLFLALEYVEGETIAERIARGPLPLDETLDLCRQVAAALEAAHEGGVVHRDLKPATIKITPAGDVKVLDFGIAKGGSGAASDSSIDPSHSPTMSLAVTGAGVILGTAAYMSPERAQRGVVTRFTDEPGEIGNVAWSPDGTRIAYMWSDNSPQIIKVKSLAGNTVETFLDSDPLFKGRGGLGWTSDGRSIIYSRLDPQTQWDLRVLPLDGDRTPRAYLNTRFNELHGRVSWDGRWIAYRSDESGRWEAYVQSFPVPGGKYQVTSGGAAFVGWHPDGRHLTCRLNSDPAQMLEAEVQGGSEFRLGPPRVLVTLPEGWRGLSADHELKRLLVLLPAEKDPTPSITVVLDALPGASGRQSSVYNRGFVVA